MKKKLREFCLNILAHNWIDSEVTLCGNGICCSEAAGVVMALMKIFEIKIPDAEIRAAAVELAKNYGIPEEEVWGL